MKMPDSPDKINILVNLINTTHSQVVAKNANSPGTQIDGYEAIWVWDNDAVPKSGFYGVVFENISDKTLTLVYRGTDFTKINDVITDVDIGLDKNPEQLHQALEMFLIAEKYGTVKEIVGHSLGGGIAEYVGALTGVTTYTFNGVGVKKLLEKISPTMANAFSAQNCSNITNYISQVDLVGNLFEHCSNKTIYVSRPKDLISDRITISKFATLKKNINTFSELVTEFRKPVARLGIHEISDFLTLWANLKKAHAVENFIDLTDADCSSTTLLP